MKSIQEITQLIDDGAFNLAEEALLDHKGRGESGSLPDYFLGCVFDNYKNPQRSEKQAKYYFKLAIQNSSPIEDAFAALARLEKYGSPHKVRILRRGLSFFPNSIRLHEMLLASLDVNNKEKLFNDMVSAGLISINSVAIMVRAYLEVKKHKEALDLINKFWVDDKSEDIILNLIKAFCYLQIDNADRARRLFIELIDSDITHKLGHAQYYGLIVCHIKASKLPLAVGVFDQIPFEEEIQIPFDPDFGPLDDLYLECATQALQNLLNTTKDKKVIAKARGLRALINSHVELEQNQSRAKLLADFRYANKYIPDNKVFCLALADQAIQDFNYEKAHGYTTQYLRNAAWLGKEALEEANYSYIQDAPEEIFTLIHQNLIELLQKGDYIDMKVLPGGPCIPVIERLFQAKRYEEIVQLTNAMSKELYGIDDVLFEAAFSFSEHHKHAEAKRCYEIYDKKFPGSASVENNLGVLYEGEGDLINARSFFEKALERDKNSALYKRNLTRVINIEKSVPDLLQSNLITKRALTILWNERDIDDLFPEPFKTLNKHLSNSTQEIDDLVEDLKSSNAITSVNDGYHNYKCQTFRINPFLLEHIEAIEEEVDRTVGVVSALEKVKPESLANIGYDEKLTNSLKRIASFEVQQQLQRDLREAAIALLSESYKTTLVLSGSIIEAILFDKVSSKGIKKYETENGKNKATNRMDLGDLLFVSEKESIIEPQLFHLAQALRSFRNLIHPGLEQRLAAIQVTEQNARIAWDITCKLICEV